VASTIDAVYVRRPSSGTRAKLRSSTRTSQPRSSSGPSQRE
jgi:hypothetical protein